MAALGCLFLALAAQEPARAGHKNNVNGEFTVLKSEPGTEFQKRALGAFVLLKGAVLAQARQPLEIIMNECTIKLKKGTAVLLAVKDDIGLASDLTEHSEYSVDVNYADRSLQLTSGRQIIFGPNESKVAAVAKDEPGSHQLLRKYEAKNHGVIAEFQIWPASILDANDMIESIKTSKQPAERKLYDEIVKTNAALTMMHR